MGPQHPSTHGVLRLVLELDGEMVKQCKPDIGFLHTGFEKTFERHNFSSASRTRIAWTTCRRCSTTSASPWRWRSCSGSRCRSAAQYIRVLMCELTRIASHLLWFGTSALDLGATSPFIYAWRDREKLLDINELVSGVRMHTSFIRVGGLLADVPDEFYDMVNEFVLTFPRLIDQYEMLITKNPIWRERTRRARRRSRVDDAMNYGATGPILRGRGVAYDLRKAQPYSSYDHFDFDVPIARQRRRVRPLPGAHAGDAQSR